MTWKGEPITRNGTRETILKITVVGLGHVGLVAAAALAVKGHEVRATDVDRAKLEEIRGAKEPFFEPDLTQCLASASLQGTLKFAHTDEFTDGLGDVALVTVGTSLAHGYATDLRAVSNAVSWIKENSNGNGSLVLVMKSTVPPGTGLELLTGQLAGTDIGFVANPEFLREGQALSDWEHPDRIVIGTDADDLRSAEVVLRMYAGIDAPVLTTDITSAEMIKYACNAFLATRISFINEMAALCDALGASIDDVSKGLALDSRTGTRIHAGVGYGGSCLPKDVTVLDTLAQTHHVNADLLQAVASVNTRQRELPIHALRKRFGGSLSGVRIGVLGLAFKPKTDDVRNAPALDLLRFLREEGAFVVAHDPMASESARQELPNSSIHFIPDMLETCLGAQALVLMTEWPEIVYGDWAEVASQMDPPRFIFDGRNSLDPEEMTSLGFEYMGVGRLSTCAVEDSVSD